MTDIAVQLARRDQRIEQLEAELTEEKRQHMLALVALTGAFVTEAKDPETLYALLRPDGTPVLVESEDPTADNQERNRFIDSLPFQDDSARGSKLHVTPYEKRNPEERAHLLKGAELLRITLGRRAQELSMAALTEPEVEWLTAERKRRGDP